MAKKFDWDTYYIKKTKRVKKIDMRLERIRREARRLMNEKVALVSEGFPHVE